MGHIPSLVALSLSANSCKPLASFREWAYPSPNGWPRLSSNPRMEASTPNAVHYDDHEDIRNRSLSHEFHEFNDYLHSVLVFYPLMTVKNE